MILTSEQFLKLKELERSIVGKLSNDTKEILLATDLVLTDELYDTPNEAVIECPVRTLAIEDLNHRCAKVDSTVLQELSDYYQVMSTIVNNAEQESQQSPYIPYGYIKIKCIDDIFGENGKTYDEFINLFK